MTEKQEKNTAKKESIFKKLFSLKNRYKKKEDITRKLPNAKIKNRLAIFISWFLIILIIVLSCFLIFKKGADRVSLIKNSEKIEEIEKLVNNSNVYNSKMDNFAKNFVTNYINIEKGKLEERKKRLNQYYLSGLEDNVFVNDGINRELNSIRLYSSEQITNEDFLYKYIISYTLSEKNNKKVKQELITISLKEIDNVYSVSNSPYFSNIPKDVSKGEYQPKNIDLEKEVDKREEIEKYTKEFFKKYTTYKIEEMQYLMDSPESILTKNLGDFKKVDIYKDTDGYKVYVEVYLVDKEIKLSSLEKFTLKVIIKDNKYYISKLEHN